MGKIKNFLKGPVFGTLVCFAVAAILFFKAGKFYTPASDICGGTAFIIIGILYFIACKADKK